ncbi:MAG: AsmA-like C-terminal region-containing protein [Kiritimatiellales bacterium]
MSRFKQRCERCRRFFYRLGHLFVFSLLLIAALLYFTLRVNGLPESAVDRVRSALNSAGVPLQFDSIRLTLRRGWLLENARFYGSPDEVKPMLSTRKLYITTWPVNWSTWTMWRLKISAKAVTVSPGYAWDEILSPENPFNTISTLEASLYYEPGRITLRRAAAQWGGINFRAGGTVAFSGSKITEEKIPPDAKIVARRFQRSTALAADALSRLAFERVPQIFVEFDINTMQPETSVLTAALNAERLVWNEHRYRTFAGAFNFSNQVWTVSQLDLLQTDGSGVRLHGTFDTVSEELTGTLDADISAPDFLPLLSDNLRSQLNTAGIVLFGHLDFSAVAGPAPLPEVIHSLSADLRRISARRDDLIIHSLAAQLMYKDDQLSASNITAAINNGIASGQFTMNTATRMLAAHVHTKLHPAAISPLSSLKLRHFINRFTVTDDNITTDLIITHAGVSNSLTVAGTISAGNFSCAGVPVETLHTVMLYSNNTVRLDPLKLTRDTEYFNGMIDIDFNADIAHFDAVSSFPPPDVAQIIAPDVQTPLNCFTFNGAVTAEASGTVDFGAETNHAFAGSVQLHDVHYEQFKIDSFRSDVEGRGTQLIFHNVSAGAYHGTIAGSADFDLFAADGRLPYRASARVAKADVRQLIPAFTAGVHPRTHGDLSGHINLTGDAAAGFWDSVAGYGHVDIIDGHLADLPLFGGLARLMQATVPFFNIFTLTTLSGDFTLRNGALHSENAYLGGTLFSANGRGQWTPENGLNFIVRAEPLRQTADDRNWYNVAGWFVEALKKGTSPLFRILEFDLTGPLEHPDWQLSNLPRFRSGPE